MTDKATEHSEPDQPLGLPLNDQLGPLPEAPIIGVSRFGSVFRGYSADHMRAFAAQERAAERERLLALAKKRADYEASAAAHHAGRWHVAHEHHLKRHAAMRDLIEALEGPNAKVTG